MIKDVIIHCIDVSGATRDTPPVMSAEVIRFEGSRELATVAPRPRWLAMMRRSNDSTRRELRTGSAEQGEMESEPGRKNALKSI